MGKHPRRARIRRALYLSGLLCAVAIVLLAQQRPTAKDQLGELRQQAKEQRDRGDTQARLATILAIENLLNHSPRSLLSTAAAYTAAGRQQEALAALEKLAAMGEADDRLREGKDTEFASLHENPRYRAVLSGFAHNESPVSRAEPVLTLCEPGFLTEDIDYDASSHSFLVTSILQKKIIRVSKNGACSEFARSPSDWPIFALKNDAKRKRVWATEVAPDGFHPAPQDAWGRSAVLCFDLVTGRLLRRIEAPHNTALGDMALLPDGLPLVSDGTGGGIYRVDGDTLKRIDRGDFISPQTPALLPDGRHALIPDYLRGIARLDLETGEATWLRVDERAPLATSGIDGLYRAGTSLLLIQNGTSPERVGRITADDAFSTLRARDVIERSTPTLGDPTHGVIVGPDFYYLENSGWSELDDHGDLRAGGKLTPARIVRFRLQ